MPRRNAVKSSAARTARQSSPSPSESATPVGLDVTLYVHRLCNHLCRTLPELGHIDMSRVALRICQTRRRGPYGVQATMTPLRFREGATTTLRRGKLWAIHPLPRDSAGRDYLYLFSLYVPRFLDLSAEEKLAVTIHELWHISQTFDGDLRRYEGRYHAHGSSCEEYHRDMRRMAAAWLATRPDSSLYDFWEGDFAAMHRRYGRVYGMKIPTPRLWRLDRLRPASLQDAARRGIDAD